MELSSLEENMGNIRLNIHQPSEKVLHLGSHGPAIDWYIHTEHTLANVCQRPDLQLGRSYINGEWDIDSTHLSDLITALVLRQPRPGVLRGRSWLRQLRARLPQLHQRSTRIYWQDSSAWLSRICLGEAMSHNCAIYAEAGTTTEQAQRLAARHLADRLQLDKKHHILDLNAGWGMLALFLAEHLGVIVTAMVSNREQLQYAHSEARRRGLEGRVHFRLGNLHQCRGRFDRILASGFLEQFAESTYPVLFKQIQSLLHENGFAWLQVTGKGHAGGLSHQWHRQQLPVRHSLPRLSDLCASIEHSRLKQLQIEDYSSHWLQDLYAQARRYHKHRADISTRFGEARTRHWEFLLASQTSAVQMEQLTQYDVLLGQAHCRWPAIGQRTPVEQLPAAIAQQVPGLSVLRSH